MTAVLITVNPETSTDVTVAGAEIDPAELQDFLSLILRHWNVIADTLSSGDLYLPLLLLDANGVSRANDWAKGFVRGMRVHPGDWSLLIDDEDHGGSLVPIFALAHEHDPTPHCDPTRSRLAWKSAKNSSQA